MGDLFPSLWVSTSDGSFAAERVQVGWDAWQTVKPLAKSGIWSRWRFWHYCRQAFRHSVILLHIDDHYQAVRCLNIQRGDDGLIHVCIENYDSRWARYWAMLRKRYQTQTLMGRSVTVSAMEHELKLVFAGKPLPAAVAGQRAIALPFRVSLEQPL